MRKSLGPSMVDSATDPGDESRRQSTAMPDKVGHRLLHAWVLGALFHKGAEPRRFRHSEAIVAERKSSINKLDSDLGAVGRPRASTRSSCCQARAMMRGGRISGSIWPPVGENLPLGGRAATSAATKRCPKSAAAVAR